MAARRHPGRGSRPFPRNAAPSCQTRFVRRSLRPLHLSARVARVPPAASPPGLGRRSAMRGMGFGEQGRQQSDQCSFTLCTICRAKIKVSWYAVALVAVQLFMVVKGGVGGGSLPCSNVRYILEGAKGVPRDGGRK